VAAVFGYKEKQIQLRKYFSRYSLGIDSSRTLLSRLVGGIIKFKLVQFVDDVEWWHENLDVRYLMLDRESDASKPYVFATTILVSPSAARILISACLPPFTNMSIFAAAEASVGSTTRLSKSLPIFPCAVSATRWKAESLGRKAQAFPWAMSAWTENVPCSHQSYEAVRFPRCRTKSILVKQL